MSLSEIGRLDADLTSNEALCAEAKRSGPPSARVEAAMAAIGSVDLSAVKRKVVEDRGWSGAIADYAELRYRRFLCMHLLEPDLVLVPPPDIDAFWHQHILFTQEYARECERLFGMFLHHSPASGEAGEAEVMQQQAMETAKFYAQTFGEHYFAAEPEGLASNWVDFFG